MSSTGSRAWRTPNQMVKPAAAAKKISGRNRAKARSTRSWSRLRVVSAVTKTKGSPETWRWTAITRMGWPRKWE
jgi:hypothetical protein